MRPVSRILMVAAALLLGSLVVVGDADAKRLGGSRSFGMNRDSGAMRQASPAPAPANPSQSAAPVQPQQPMTAPQPSRTNRWLGPLAGLAAGIGLAALLSHFGLGEGFANVLLLMLLVGAAVFIFRRFFARPTPTSAYGNLAPAGNVPLRFEPLSPSTGNVANSAVPAGFDVEGFLRQAKLNFIRLQAANDAGNLEDLKQFLAPEVFAEIQLQYEARGRSRQETDVQQLDAELLEVVTEGNLHVASVRFSGTIREDGGVPGGFAEIWHLAKPLSGERGWQVAGIQQIQ